MLYILLALVALVALYTLIGRAESDVARERLRKLMWTVGIVVFAVFMLRVGFHWIAVAAGAMAALLTRGLSLLRYMPLFKRAYSAYQHRGQADSDDPENPFTGRSGHDVSGARRFGMSHEEAREVLGVKENANRDEIMRAYRELMRKMHPDQGGSTFLAKQINEAKQVLLG